MSQDNGNESREFRSRKGKERAIDDEDEKPIFNVGDSDDEEESYRRRD